MIIGLYCVVYFMSFIVLFLLISFHILSLYYFWHIITSIFWPIIFLRLIPGYYSSWARFLIPFPSFQPNFQAIPLYSFLALCLTGGGRWWIVFHSISKEYIVWHIINSILPFSYQSFPWFVSFNSTTFYSMKSTLFY